MIAGHVPLAPLAGFFLETAAARDPQFRVRREALQELFEVARVEGQISVQLDDDVDRIAERRYPRLESTDDRPTACVRIGGRKNLDPVVPVDQWSGDGLSPVL